VVTPEVWYKEPHRLHHKVCRMEVLQRRECLECAEAMVCLFFGDGAIGSSTFKAALDLGLGLYDKYAQWEWESLQRIRSGLLSSLGHVIRNL
jgi:hypothetical protein